MKKLIIPAFVMLIGAGCAYATDLASNDESALIPKQGYIYNLSTNQCDPAVMCRTEPGPVCTVNGLPSGQQVFGTSGADSEHPLTCDITLRKIPD